MALKSLFIRRLIAITAVCLMITGFCANIQKAEATDLPPKVIEYLTKTYPGTNIRFDGLIQLSDGTLYLPVLPVTYDDEGEFKVSMSLPDAAQRPDLVIFSNNLSLLRIITGSKGEKTILGGTQVPLKVKLGLLPQDLVIPEGLIIPPDMNSILGDLLCPQYSNAPKINENQQNTQDVPVNANANSQESDSLVGSEPVKTPEVTQKQPVENQKQVVESPKQPVESSKQPTEEPKQPKETVKRPETTLPEKDNLSNIAPKEDVLTVKDENVVSRLPGVTPEGVFGLADRKIYLTNINANKLYVVDPQLAKTVNTIDVGSLPYAAVLSHDGKKLYVVSMGANTVAAVNTETNTVENMIKVGLRPVDIDISPDGTKLFVANSGSGTVSIVNTDLFEISGNIEVQGMPEGVFASSDNQSFYTFNRSTGVISRWNTVNTEDKQFLFMIKNPYDLTLDPQEEKLYVISRTNNSLMVYNLKEKKYESAVNVGSKPVGVVLSPDGRFIYTLDAGDDKVSVIDSSTYQIVKSIELRTTGFPSSLTLVPGTNIGLVTNAESDQLTLVDLENAEVLTNIPVGVTSKSLILGPVSQIYASSAKETPKTK